jgi:FMN phosphatase YigB (HAD superfamily)
MNDHTVFNAQAEDRNVPACELMATWSARLDGKTVATFDCFDTVFWRGVVAPNDVYFALAEDPLFVEHRIGARVRMAAETHARTNGYFANRTSETTLEQIYAQCAPNAHKSVIADLAEREVQKEIEIGFVFEPVLAMMREAKARGLAVAIVSDTYYTEAQLRRILFATAPELETLIDRVFCSSAFGMNKSSGLWPIVIEKLGVPAGEILHTGDNPVADYAAPVSFGVQALHFVQHDDAMARAARQRMIAARMLFPAIRATQAAPSLFHGLQALQTRRVWQQDEKVGYWTVGPIVHSLARYLLDEYRALAANGKPHKLAFLMRDAHLVHQACRQMSSDWQGGAAFLSRYTAIASSFDTKLAIERYAVQHAAPNVLHVICDQMLMPPELKQEVLERCVASGDPVPEFKKIVVEPAVSKVIMRQSAELRARLFRHLQRSVGLKLGETLVLADNGYYGTIQRAIGDVFKRHFNVDVVGRYLFTMDSPGSHLTRQALIDPSWADETVIESLIAHIGDFEQMCSIKTGSVIGYEADGTPILAELIKNDAQIDTQETIQRACLEFIRDVERVAPMHLPKLTRENLRVNAAIEVARMVYLPEEEEIARSARSVFELNAGTDVAFGVANIDAGIKGLRERGPFYMRSVGKGFRTGYPSEMRFAGIDQAIFLMAIRRHRLDFTIEDTSYRSMEIPALFVRGNESATQTLSARATFDGYYSVVLPRSEFDTALLIGRELSLLQLESAVSIPASRLDTASEHDLQRPLNLGAEIIFDGMKEREAGIYEVSPGGLIYLPASHEREPQVMRLIFRPLAKARAAQLANAA